MDRADAATALAGSGGEAGGRGRRFADWRALAALVALAVAAASVRDVPPGARALPLWLGRPGKVVGPGLRLVGPYPFGRLVPLMDAAPRWTALPGNAGGLLYRAGLAASDARAMAALAEPGRIIADLAAAAMLVPGADAAAALRGTLARAAPGIVMLAIDEAMPGTAAGLQTGGAGATVAGPPAAVESPLLAAARSQAARLREAAKRRTETTIAAARARAAEIVDAARVTQVGFTADRDAAKLGGRAFLLERYFSSLSRALAKSPKTIIDHRLNWPEAPEMDLRPPSGVLPGDGTR